MLVSLYGAYLNVLRNRWGFFLWMISNSFWMGWDFYIGEYAQSGLFACFLYLAIKGFFSWKEEEPEPVRVKVTDR
jgi:nicotinamide riboside transporter PnuC